MKTIRVTATDIKRGLSTDPWGCPVALAMKRATGNRWGVSRVEFFLRKRTIKTPIAVNRFIKQFDCGKKVKPFSFKVKI